MVNNRMRAVHPGEVLREEYLRPLGMSPGELAKALNVTKSRVSEIVSERRRVSANTALRLARYFGGSESDAQGWINLQAAYDLKVAQIALGKEIAKQVQPRSNSTRS